MKTITVSASEFKARCLKLMESGNQVIVTKRGKAVARLLPVVPQREPIMGRWKGRSSENGDIAQFRLGPWEVD